MGKKAADTLMAHLPPVGWADVATKTDLRLLAAEITRDVNAQIAEVNGNIAELAAEVNGKIAELDKKMTDLRVDLERLRGDMEKMRADLTSSYHRTTIWLVLAVSTMPQVVSKVLSLF